MSEGFDLPMLPAVGTLYAPYEVGKEANCGYYLPTEKKQAEPKELKLFDI